jgi:predicted Rossmann fold nucleotide-binding protein DprA/Smf involved in DNA uptake
MDLSGNRELLDSSLVAFFASRTAPPEALTLATRWAHEIAEQNKVVISGFHSPIEREVFSVLEAHSRPVIVALGRSLYRKIPSHFQPAFEQQRLLFISFREQRRPSLSNSQLRNWAVAEMASQVVFAPFAPSSQLSALCFSLSLGATKIIVLE